MIRSTLSLAILVSATTSPLLAQEMTLTKRNIWPSASPISNLEQLLGESTPSAWNGVTDKVPPPANSTFSAIEVETGNALSSIEATETQPSEAVSLDFPMTANIALDDEAHLKKYMNDNDVKRMIQQRAQRERELRQMRLESQRFYGVSASRPSGARLMYGGMVAPTGYGASIFGQGPRRPSHQSLGSVH
jgi:hypothetical protein